MSISSMIPSELPIHRVADVAEAAQSDPRDSASRSGTRHAKPLRIGVFGLFGAGNLGNDGSLESFVEFMRTAHPEAELQCICSGTDSVRERFALPTRPIQAPAPRNRWLRGLNKLSLRTLFRAQEWGWTIAAASRFDMIVVPGTGMLDDFGERWRDMPYHLFRWGLACRVAGTPFAFVSIGAGPIHHPLSRWLMRSAAAMARYRSYRDANSKDYMRGIGLDRAGDLVTPDLAFRLPSPQVTARPTGRPVIGVGVMGYAGWKHSQSDGQAIYRAYTAKMAQFVSWLIEEGYAVRLVMGDEGDIPAVQEVSRAITAAPGGMAAHLAFDRGRSLTDIMQQLGETELLVATRFHNVVCALMMGKPVISLSYARKNDVLLEEMGLGSFCQHIESFSLDRLKAQFQELMLNRADYIPGIVEKTTQYREKLAEQETRLLAQLS